MAKKVYAVRKGHKPGLYKTWPECAEQVQGFSGAEYKGFRSRDAALAWLDDGAEDRNDASLEENRQASGQSPAGEEKVESGTVDVDLPPWEISAEEEARLRQRAREKAPNAETPAPDTAAGENAEENLAERRLAKAEAFIAFLGRHDVGADIIPTNSAHYHRIGLKAGGYIDLYLTSKKPFDLHITGVKNVKLKQQIERLWRIFHWQVGEETPRSSNRWKVADDYYTALKPFAHLNFDFLPLAEALEQAAEGAPPAESIRFDFEQIEEAYLELRPRTHE